MYLIYCRGPSERSYTDLNPISVQKRQRKGIKTDFNGSLNLHESLEQKPWRRFSYTGRNRRDFTRSQSLLNLPINREWTLLPLCNSSVTRPMHQCLAAEQTRHISPKSVGNLKPSLEEPGEFLSAMSPLRREPMITSLKQHKAESDLQVPSINGISEAGANLRSVIKDEDKRNVLIVPFPDISQTLVVQPTSPSSSSMTSPVTKLPEVGPSMSTGRKTSIAGSTSKSGKLSYKCSSKPAKESPKKLSKKHTRLKSDVQQKAAIKSAQAETTTEVKDVQMQLLKDTIANESITSAMNTVAIGAVELRNSPDVKFEPLKSALKQPNSRAKKNVVFGQNLELVREVTKVSIPRN